MNYLMTNPPMAAVVFGACTFLLLLLWIKSDKAAKRAKGAKRFTMSGLTSLLALVNIAFYGTVLYFNRLAAWNAMRSPETVTQQVKSGNIMTIILVADIMMLLICFIWLFNRNRRYYALLPVKEEKKAALK